MNPQNSKFRKYYWSKLMIAIWVEKQESISEETIKTLLNIT